MRLLFLTPQLPWPPRQGGALRSNGLIRALAARHEVHLLSFGPGEDAVPSDLASLTLVPLPERGRARRLLELLTRPEPDMARRLVSPAMARTLRELLARHDFDIVQVESLEMIPFALPHLGQPGPRWLYDALNAESDLQRSAWLAERGTPRRWHAAAYSGVQTLKLRAFERRTLPRFDGVTAVSEEDAALLADVSGVKVHVVPNGIDSAAIAPGLTAPAAELAARGGASLLFTGKMDYRPNVDGILWFVDEVLPRVESAPLTLWVVGQSPHRALERLREHPNVMLTGWVEAVEPFLAGADVVVVPLRMGSGTRLKVLQALGMARPLVGTTLGCAGLAVQDGQHLRLADEAPAFAAAIDMLLADPSRASAMAARGRAHVQAHFDWEVIVPRLEAAYHEIVRR